MGIKNDKFSSAIYFDGENCRPERYTNLTMGTRGEYKKVQERKKWVSYLDQGEIRNDGVNASTTTYKETWIEENKMSQNIAENLLHAKLCK